MTDRLKAIVSLRNTILVLGLVQLGWLIWYYYTGLGGEQQLVANVLPIALALQILLLIGAIPSWPYSRGWGYGPSGLLGIILIIIIVLLVLGRI